MTILEMVHNEDSYVSIPTYKTISAEECKDCCWFLFRFNPSWLGIEYGGSNGCANEKCTKR